MIGNQINIITVNINDLLLPNDKVIELSWERIHHIPSDLDQRWKSTFNSYLALMGGPGLFRSCHL